MFVEIVVENIENEPHSFMVDIASYNPERDFLEALEKGEELIGFSLKSPVALKTVPYEALSTLIDEGFDINSFDSEVYPDELYNLSPKEYFLINLFLAQRGNPKLEIIEVDEIVPQIKLGRAGPVSFTKNMGF